MANVQSFLRGQLRGSISETATVPFTMNVSVVPESDNMYLTLSPETENEEIVYFTTRVGTAGSPGTVNVTARGYAKATSSTSTANQRPHAVNDSYVGSVTHLNLQDFASKTSENVFTEMYIPPTFADDAAADASYTGGTAPNGSSFYSTAAGALRVKQGGVWTNSTGSADFAQTRNIASASAPNGELFRDSGSSNDLSYRDHSGTVRNLVVNATGKFDTNRYDIATTADVETGTDDTKPVTPRGVRDAMATDGEAAANTDQAHYVNPKQLHDNIKNSLASGSSSYSDNTNYQASTSGFVTAFCGDNAASWDISGYTDSSNPPTTRVAHNAWGLSGFANQGTGFICFPVKKNDYWKVVGSSTRFFFPMQ